MRNEHTMCKEDMTWDIFFCLLNLDKATNMIRYLKFWRRFCKNWCWQCLIVIQFFIMWDFHDWVWCSQVPLASSFFLSLPCQIGPPLCCIDHSCIYPVYFSRPSCLRSPSVYCLSVLSVGYLFSSQASAYKKAPKLNFSHLYGSLCI